MEGEVVSRPCTECGVRMGVHDWSYAYGHRRRGTNPKTGERDERPLGRREVVSCRRCEFPVLRADVFQAMSPSFLPIASLLAALLLFLLGLRPMPGIEPSYWVFLAGPAGLALLWLAYQRRRRRPVAMRKGFFELHRDELARKHGLPARAIEAYVESAAPPADHGPVSFAEETRSGA